MSFFRIAPGTLLFALFLGLVCAGTGCSDSSTDRPLQEKEWTSLIDGERAFRDLKAFAEVGPMSHEPGAADRIRAGRALIKSKLREAGIEDLGPTHEWIEEVPSASGGRKVLMENIVGVLPGKRKDVILIGCHYDIKLIDGGFVGANDGCSGVALTLELARVLAQRAAAGEPLEHTIWFTFFDGEEAFQEWRATAPSGEPDHLYGSRTMADRVVAQSLPVKAVVILDLVADRDLLLTEDTSSTDAMVEIFRDASKEVFGLDLFGPAKAIEDDHLPFLEKDIPAIDLIDFDYGPNNRYWHSLEDTVDKCSARSLDYVGTLVLAALPEISRWLVAR